MGLIGAGTFGKGILFPSFLNTKGFDFLGVTSNKGISAKSVADRYSASYAYRSVDELLNNKHINAVVISTRHDSHADYVVKALEKNIHVFVEKPLALNFEELNKVKSFEKKSSATLTVGFNRRHSPLVSKVKGFFNQRTEPMAINYRVNSGRIPLDSENSWVHQADIGGGRIIGECCHFIDLLCYLTGETPTSVQATNLVPDRTNLASNDVLTFTISFSGGSIGTVHYFSNGTMTYPKERIEIFCGEKVGVIDNFRSIELADDKRVSRKKAFNVDKGYKNQAKSFLNTCLLKEEPTPFKELYAITETTFLIEDIIARGDH